MSRGRQAQAIKLSREVLVPVPPEPPAGHSAVPAGPAAGAASLASLLDPFARL